MLSVYDETAGFTQPLKVNTIIIIIIITVRMTITSLRQTQAEFPQRTTMAGPAQASASRRRADVVVSLSTITSRAEVELL